MSDNTKRLLAIVALIGLVQCTIGGYAFDGPVSFLLAGGAGLCAMLTVNLICSVKAGR